MLCHIWWKLSAENYSFRGNSAGREPRWVPIEAKKLLSVCWWYREQDSALLCVLDQALSSGSYHELERIQLELDYRTQSNITRQECGTPGFENSSLLIWWVKRFFFISFQKNFDKFFCWTSLMNRVGKRRSFFKDDQFFNLISFRLWCDFPPTFELINQ